MSSPSYMMSPLQGSFILIPYLRLTPQAMRCHLCEVGIIRRVYLRLTPQAMRCHLCEVGNKPLILNLGLTP